MGKSHTSKAFLYEQQGGTGGGSGDVVGPGSSTDNALARFNGSSGKTIQNSSWTLDDNGDMAVGALGDKLILDADLDTYLVCPSDDVLDVYAGTVKNLTFTTTGMGVSVALSPLSSTLNLGATGGFEWRDVFLNRALWIGEVAAEQADAAGYGQLWVKNDAPNTLWFTDDGGTDHQLGVGAATATLAAAVVADHTLVRGDGGVRGVQDSGWTLDDNDDLTVGALGDRLVLDADDDTYLVCAGDDVLDFYTAATKAWVIDASQSLVAGNQGNKISLLPDGSSYIQDTGIIRLYEGGLQALSISQASGLYVNIDIVTGENIFINDGKRIVIGTDDDTYLTCAADDVLDVFLGGTKQLTLNAGGIFLGEIAAGVADVAGYGQLWVKNDTPNTLWFTDDAGTDTQLGAGGATTVTAAAVVTANELVIGDDGARGVKEANWTIDTATGDMSVGARGDKLDLSADLGEYIVSDADNQMNFYVGTLGSGGEVFRIAGNIQCFEEVYFQSGCYLPDADLFRIGTSGNDTLLLHSTAQTVDSAVMALGDDSHSLIICDNDHYTTDWGHAQQTSPTFIFQSEDNGDASKHLKVFHDQTHGNLEAGTGGLKVTVAGGGLFLSEVAAAAADIAAYGQLWVKNTTPCELWFTDDAGADTQIV